jgi:hypothetical protein
MIATDQSPTSVAPMQKYPELFSQLQFIAVFQCFTGTYWGNPVQIPALKVTKNKAHKK